MSYSVDPAEAVEASRHRVAGFLSPCEIRYTSDGRKPCLADFFSNGLRRLARRNCSVERGSIVDDDNRCSPLGKLNRDSTADAPSGPGDHERLTIETNIPFDHLTFPLQYRCVPAW